MVRRAGGTRRVPPLAVVGAGLVLLAALVAWVVVARATGGGSPRRAAAELAQGALEQRAGVRVTRVAATGGGGLIDLRFQVVDPDKAAIVHSRPPAIVDEETGQAIDTYFMGHIHFRKFQAGLTYPVLLVNQKGLIARGRSVSVKMGGALLRHVEVE